MTQTMAPPGAMPPGMTPQQQRVLHRHVHHHVHYHEGGEGAAGSASPEPMASGSDGESMMQNTTQAKPFMTGEDQRQFEMACEARVKAQMEGSPPPGGGVDPSLADTPTNMRRGASMGKLAPIDPAGMTRTQEAFKRTPSLPQLNRQQDRGFARNVDKAMDAYSDSKRPTYVTQKPRR